MRDTTPPMPSMPPLVTNISATNRPKARKMRMSPAQLKGSTLSEKKAMMRAMAPKTPGKIWPGWTISKKRAIEPRLRRRKVMLGSLIRSRKRSAKFMSLWTISASLVARVTLPSTSCTSRASTASKRELRSSATRSTTFSSTASVSVAETASRTACSAHSALRPR